MNIKEKFERDGLVVRRALIDPISLKMMQVAWGELSKTPRKVGFNPVALDGPFPEALNMIYRHPSLLDAVCEVFGPDLALYNFRFVVKDEHSRKGVFMHQDTGYHVGWPTKLSAFVALTPVDSQNGGMVYYPGTHKFGYLGDAGEIDPRKADRFPGWISPDLFPGDVVLMHSATWHASWSPNPRDQRVRVLADIIYQPANDPSGKELLRGEWRCEPQPWLHDKDLFLRSRSSRLIELQKQVDELKGQK